MRTINPKILGLAIGVLASALVSCSSSTQTATKLDYTPVKTAKTSSSSKLENNIHAGINSIRASINKSQLQRHPELDRLARQHSQFMAQNAGKFKLDGGKRISHFGFQSRALKLKHGMDMQSISENVGAAPNSSNVAGVLVNAWRNSRGHYINMKAMYKHTGVGVVVSSDGYVYATQIFANDAIAGDRWINGKPQF